MVPSEEVVIAWWYCVISHEDLADSSLFGGITSVVIEVDCNQRIHFDFHDSSPKEFG